MVCLLFEVLKGIRKGKKIEKGEGTKAAKIDVEKAESSRTVRVQLVNINSGPLPRSNPPIMGLPPPKPRPLSLSLFIIHHFALILIIKISIPHPTSPSTPLTWTYKAQPSFFILVSTPSPSSPKEILKITLFWAFNHLISCPHF